MNVSNYVLNEEIHALSRIKETGHGRAYLAAIMKRINEERERIESCPTRDDRDLKRDIAYQLGFIAGLRWASRLPEEAEALIKRIGPE